MDRLLSEEELLTPPKQYDSGVSPYNARTLKAVGEWLETIRVDHADHSYIYSVQDKDIDQLKQGKMPEEG